jgi:hypothetical protein
MCEASHDGISGYYWRQEKSTQQSTSLQYGKCTFNGWWDDNNSDICWGSVGSGLFSPTLYVNPTSLVATGSPLSFPLLSHWLFLLLHATKVKETIFRLARHSTQPNCSQGQPICSSFNTLVQPSNSCGILIHCAHNKRKLSPFF